MIINAANYSHLVGKYVIMSRLATLEEVAATGDQVVGGEGYVSGVTDDQNDVVVIFAHRETWRVTGRDAMDWKMEIWANARARDDWKKVASV